MSDLLTTARSARESLARGLNALQADPNVPAQLLEAAAPIAQAMGALHQIEKSQGAQLQPHAETALSHVRSALSQLQAQPSAHPAVAQALEAVAGSLGLVHALTRGAVPAAPQPVAAAVPPPAPAPIAPQAPPFVAPPAPPAPPAPQAAFAATVAQPAFPVPPQHVAPPPAPPPAPVHAAPPPPAPVHAAVHVQSPPAPVHAARPAGLPAQPVFQAPAAPAGPIAAPPAPAAGNLPVIEAPLGAHSPTNFYKGLSGNDIVDHGGLFVATYKVPKIGTPIRVKVSLPGGYEFEANAVVRWSRESSDGGHDAPPGFGAQFTQITAEARQLIYRYVRNREPLFHDDL